MKRVFIFLSLVALCVAGSSANLNERTRLKYAEFQRLGQAGESARAAAGFRVLAMKYPYTAAGMKSARRLVEAGEPPVRLALEISGAGIKNTTPAEWLVLLSAFIVVTVFMAGNSLPAAILLLFVISGAGMFHLSHSLISIRSDALGAFLAVNPYLYTALSLLIAGGHLHYRRAAAAKNATRKAVAGKELTLGEQLLMRKIYSKKLKVLQARAKVMEGELRTPYGRRFVKEVGRIYDTLLNERQMIIAELVSTGVKHRKIIQASKKIIDRAKQEVREGKNRLRSKAIDPGAYRCIRLEKKSTLKENRRRIYNVKAFDRRMKTVRLKTRLQFMRRDLFQAYLHGALGDRQGTAMKVIQNHGLFHPKIARNDLRKRKVVYRNSSDVDGKLERLEQRRGKMNSLAYRDKLRSLANEKKFKEKALMEVDERISRRMELCKNQQTRLQDAIETLTEELADMNTLGKIGIFFPSLVRKQRGKIRQAIKSGRKILPVLRKIETIYNEAFS